MGALFSRRRPKSTIEILQDIDKQIDDLDANQADKEFNRRSCIGYLVIASVLLFVGLSVYWLLYFSPERGLTWRHYSFFIASLTIYSICVWMLKWTICWWYEQALDVDERKLNRLRRRKRDILDTVKDKETYKVAKEILERFDPKVKEEKAAKKVREFQQQLAIMRRYASLEGSGLTTPSELQLRSRRNRKSRSPSPRAPEKSRSQLVVAHGERNADSDAPLAIHPPPPQPTSQALQLVPVAPVTAQNRLMVNSGPLIGAGPVRSTPAAPRGQFSLVTPPAPFMSTVAPRFDGQEAAMMIPTPVRLPRPVIPRDRTAFDRLIDFLLGEGPSNRYALICQRCRSHNGMALKEEIETMAFRCCYCFAFNPARKLLQPIGQPESSAPSDDNCEQRGNDRAAGNSPQPPASSENDDESPNRASIPSRSQIQRSSSSRAPSRCSVVSRESTQSAPPFFSRATDFVNATCLPQQSETDLVPTCTAPAASTNSVALGFLGHEFGERENMTPYEEGENLVRQLAMDDASNQPDVPSDELERENMTPYKEGENPVRQLAMDDASNQPDVSSDEISGNSKPTASPGVDYGRVDSEHSDDNELSGSMSSSVESKNDVKVGESGEL